MLCLAVVEPGTARGGLAVVSSAAFAGSFGLQVAVGHICLQDDVVISGGTFTGPALACSTITAGNEEIVGPEPPSRRAAPVVLLLDARGPDFQYEPLIGDRDPPPDCRK